MKIAVLAPVWFPVPPTGYGGTEWIVSLLADGLVDAGHEVTLVASGDSHTKAELVSVFKEAPSHHIGLSFWELRHALACYVRAAEFDVINDHSGPPAAALGQAVATPVIHTIHGPLDDPPGELYAELGKFAPNVGLISISMNQRKPRPDLNWIANCPNALDSRALPVPSAPRRLPAVPRPDERRQGLPPRRRGRARDGAAAEDRRQEPRAGRAGLLRRVHPPAPLRLDRVSRRGHARREGRAAAERARDALPDQVGGAVRPGDDRVDGLRHARASRRAGARCPR